VPADASFALSDDLVGLRPFESADADAIAAACQDTEIVRWTSIPSPYSIDFARLFVTLCDTWRDEGSAFHFAIVDRRDGSFGGSIGLDAIQRPPAQVGYWVSPWARRQGFASRALQLVTTWALQDLRLEVVELVTKIGNEPSERVAANVGYEFVEEVADHEPTYGSETVRVRRWTRHHPDSSSVSQRGH
jgi:RimJ/RimL family protein N-acetyltransferase